MAPVIFFTAKAPPKLPLVISYRIREAATAKLDALKMSQQNSSQ